MLEMAAEGLGDRVAVGSLDDGLTYRQLYDRAHGAANRYRAAGVESAVVCDESSPALPTACSGSVRVTSAIRRKSTRSNILPRFEPKTRPR